MHGLRVIHFSLQSNHIHLIVEAPDNHTLTKGMRSLTITFAKGHNRGRIQIERYHLHVLRTLRETKNAAYYVMFNRQKHERGTYSTIDEYSSVFGKTDLIKQFLMMKRMVLKITRGEIWEGSPPTTWLLRKALSDDESS